jgi:hypothetical protein
MGGGHGVKDSNGEGGWWAVADEATPPKHYDEQGTCGSATPPKHYDEQGTCKSAADFFFDRLIIKNNLHIFHSPTSFYEEHADEEDGLPCANKSLPKDSAAIDVNGLLRADNSLPKISNGLPKDSATIDDDGLPHANNGLTKDSAAFKGGGLPHDDGNGLPKDLAAIDPASTVELGFKGKRAKKNLDTTGRGEKTKKSAVSHILFSPSITWNRMSFDHVVCSLLAER